MLQSDPFRAVPAVVAIPVRNEVERIGDCLVALARQDGKAPGVVLLVNNTTDATVAAVAELQAGLGMPVVVIEHEFPPELANAGQARRLAMEHADRLAPPGVPLLCTDADGWVAPGWLAANLRYLDQGADAVFGQAKIDPIEAARIPPALHEADSRECDYAATLDEIECLIDPDPNDPWPRHAEHSGASIAVRRSVFQRVGGMPPIALGEDRAFAASLRRIDARLRHPLDVWVVVSGRILGRAAGGMADTIRRRLVAPDTMLDEALEPAKDRVERIRRRQAARAGFVAMLAGNTADLQALVGQAGGGEELMRRLVRGRWFGEAWELLDGFAPQARVPVADLPKQMVAAVHLRNELRVAVSLRAMA